MKYVKRIMALLFVIIFLIGCSTAYQYERAKIEIDEVTKEIDEIKKERENEQNEDAVSSVNNDLRIIELSIEGMYCPGCASTLEHKLISIKGVVIANVNYKNASGLVVYNPNLMSVDEISSTSNTYTLTIVSDKLLMVED